MKVKLINEIRNHDETLKIYNPDGGLTKTHMKEYSIRKQVIHYIINTLR